MRVSAAAAAGAVDAVAAAGDCWAQHWNSRLSGGQAAPSERVWGLAPGRYNPHSMVRFLKYSCNLKNPYHVESSLKRAVEALFPGPRAEELQVEAQG
eukprot:9435279-Pyramimonas_sp.AAC.1